MRPWQAVEVNVIKCAEEKKWLTGGCRCVVQSRTFVWAVDWDRQGQGRSGQGTGEGRSALGDWWTEHGYRVREGDDTR